MVGLEMVHNTGREMPATVISATYLRYQLCVDCYCCVTMVNMSP